MDILDDVVRCPTFGNASMIVSNGKSASDEIIKSSGTTLRRSLQLSESFIYSQAEKFADSEYPRSSVRLTGGQDIMDDDDTVPQEQEAPPPDGEPTETIAEPVQDPPQETDATQQVEDEAAATAEAEEPPSAASRSAAPVDQKSEPPQKSEAVPPSSSKDVALIASSVQKIESRLHKVESAVSAASGTRTADHQVMRGMAIMKDQLELAMQELHHLATIMLNEKMRPQRMQALRSVANKLRAIQRDNVFIEGTHRFSFEDDQSISVHESDEMDEELVGYEEEIELRTPSSSRTGMAAASQQISEPALNLTPHITYPAEKILEQFLELKSEFCMLTNKVNDIAAALLEQDSQRTMAIIQDMQEQSRELHKTILGIKEVQERIDNKQLTDGETLSQFREIIVDLQAEKVDKAEVAIMLADKVDYAQLQRKVSIEEMKELQCRMEKQMCELNKLINLNERNVGTMLENMKNSLGFNNIEEILQKYKTKIEEEIRNLSETLKKYMDMTNDDCAAAGARVKVLQDLACISCDTTCVMRTIEKAKVPKFPNAHATSLLSPLVTYELGSIRKSGLMGYYRKDEFPHAPNAWMGRQNVALKTCVPRRAGGAHTTSTAKERVEKILMNKKEI